MYNCEKYDYVYERNVFFFFDVVLCFVLAETPLECKLNGDRNFACYLFLDVSQNN